MRLSARETKDDATKDVAFEGLLSLALLEGLLPVSGSALEHPARRPARQKAEQVAHVAERLDLVQAAAGQQRHEGRVDLAAVVAADEEPVLAPDDLAPEIQLADVVVQRQAAVVQESPERDLLISGIPDRLGNRRFVQDATGFLLAPCEE